MVSRLGRFLVLRLLNFTESDHGHLDATTVVCILCPGKFVTTFFTFCEALTFPKNKHSSMKKLALPLYSDTYLHRTSCSGTSYHHLPSRVDES